MAVVVFIGMRKMDAGAILQRTDIGRDTIRTKSVKLTQSERLVLILVDGVTPFSALRQKVWALTEERFTRALGTLVQRDLIYEVLLPLEGEQAEELDAKVVERFLQQDPLDPVTLIGVDPEDELDTNLIEAMGYSAPPSQPIFKEETLPQVGDTLTLSTHSSISLPAPSSAAVPISKPALQQNSNLSHKADTELQCKKALDQYVVDETAALISMVNAKKIYEKEVLRKAALLTKEPTGNRIYWTNHLLKGFSLFSFVIGIVILVAITSHYLF